MLTECGFVSMAVLWTSAVWAFWIYPRMKKLSWTLSPLSCFTIGVFFAGAILFWPAYFETLDQSASLAEKALNLLRQGGLAIVDALRLFVMGIEWDDLQKTATTELLPNGWTVFHCICLYLMAPLLTFTNVINHFSNLFGALRLRISHFAKIYIMSELSLH